MPAPMITWSISAPAKADRRSSMPVPPKSSTPGMASSRRTSSTTAPRRPSRRMFLSPMGGLTAEVGHRAELLPPAVLASLAARAADGHGAPVACLVATVVIERPAAVLAWTRLQARPAAVEHRDSDNGRDACQSGVEVVLARAEVGRCAGLELHEQAGTAERVVHALDGVPVGRRSVVRERQRLQAVPDVERPLELRPAEADPGLQQAAGGQPFGEGRG